MCYYLRMEPAERRHVTLPAQTITYLENYRRNKGLASFSATIEAAAEALRAQELEASYKAFTAEYEQDSDEQREAEEWLGMPMDEP